MGIVQLPNCGMHRAPSTRNEGMTRNRFHEIMTVLHYNDNNAMPGRDSPAYKRCYKIQTLIDHLRSTFKHFVLPELHMSINEQVPLFRGQCNLKRYLKNGATSFEFVLVSLAMSTTLNQKEVLDQRHHQLAVFLLKHVGKVIMLFYSCPLTSHH